LTVIKVCFFCDRSEGNSINQLYDNVLRLLGYLFVPKLDWSNSVPEGSHEMEIQSPISGSSTYNIDHKTILAFWDVKSNNTKPHTRGP
jgi:hypothetical protein